MKSNLLPGDLPADLRAYLESVPPVTPEMTERVARANRAAQDDPQFEADLMKMVFVNEMLTALDERKETKATLAERLGKTRQYIQKLFNEDKRVNYTVDTLCAVAHALGRRIHLHVYREHEKFVIISRPRTPILINAISWGRASAPNGPTLATDSFIKSTAAFSATARKEVAIEYPTAA